MKTLLRSAIIGGLIVLSGCASIRNETGSPDGFVGPLADDHLPAVTQRQRADRYLLTAMILGPLALELADDANEAAVAARRMNALGASLADLYEALSHCSPGIRPEGGAPLAQPLCGESTGAQQAARDNGYSFEALAYEVQADLFAIGREAIVTLDVDVDVGDLVSLELSAMSGLWGRLRDLMPVARRSLANYRDGLVIFSDTIAHSPACMGQSGTSTDCGRLREAMAGRYVTGQDLLDGDEDLMAMFRMARRAAAGTDWTLNHPQYVGVLAHMNRACERAFRRQEVGDQSGENGGDTEIICTTDGKISQRDDVEAPGTTGMMQLQTALLELSRRATEPAAPAQQ